MRDMRQSEGEAPRFSCVNQHTCRSGILPFSYALQTTATLSYLA